MYNFHCGISFFAWICLDQKLVCNANCQLGTNELILVILSVISFRCACSEGELSTDEKHCQQSSAFLAYAFGKSIRFLHLDGYVQEPPYSPIESASPAVGLDFDFEEKLVFFSVLAKSIMRARFNGSELTEMKVNCKFHYGNRE